MYIINTEIFKYILAQNKHIAKFNTKMDQLLYENRAAHKPQRAWFLGWKFLLKKTKFSTNAIRSHKHIRVLIFLELQKQTRKWISVICRKIRAIISTRRSSEFKVWFGRGDYSFILSTFFFANKNTLWIRYEYFNGSQRPPRIRFSSLWQKIHLDKASTHQVTVVQCCSSVFFSRTSGLEKNEVSTET